MPKKITTEDARRVLAAQGYTLISNKYINIRGLLKCACPNGHEVETTLFDFKQGYKRCPCQSSRKPWEGYNLVSEHPEVLLDWDFRLNKSIKPQNMTPGSAKKVWWECKKCKIPHSYLQSIDKHVNLNRRCPYYYGRRAGYGNDLYSNFKTMCDIEWDWSSNDLWPNEVTTKTHLVVWWKCFKCNVRHSYQMKISEKTGGRGCPFYAGKSVGFGNSVKDMFPEVASEWDYKKNSRGPEEYCYGSNRKVWFVHKEGGELHNWRAAIKNRTVGNTKCPQCSSKNISIVSQKWLDSLGIRNLKKEYKIIIGDTFIKVDGYDPETNTVYEFLGDYWHGNPEVYHHKKINCTRKKTFGKLYKETLARLRLLEKEGYKVIYIWEKDFNLKGLKVKPK